MKEFDLRILGRAVVDATFSAMTKPFAHPLAVVHAAHGAAIILKARIGQDHPLSYSRACRNQAALRTT